MFLLFNSLSRFIIAFPSRSKHLLISWLQSPSAVTLQPKKIKSVTVSTVSPSIRHEVMGLQPRGSVASSGCTTLEEAATVWPSSSCNTPHPESGAVAALCWSGCEEIPHVQGQRNPSKTVGPGAAVRRYPCPRAKEKPQKDGRRGEFAFRIKPHSRERCSEGSNKPCVHQDTETPERVKHNCV